MIFQLSGPSYGSPFFVTWEWPVNTCSFPDISTQRSDWFPEFQTTSVVKTFSLVELKMFLTGWAPHVRGSLLVRYFCWYNDFKTSAQKCWSGCPTEFLWSHVSDEILRSLFGRSENSAASLPCNDSVDTRAMRVYKWTVVYTLANARLAFWTLNFELFSTLAFVRGRC